MFKPIKEVADRAGEVWVAAETKIGSELLKMPKAKGTREYLGDDPTSFVISRNLKRRHLSEPWWRRSWRICRRIGPIISLQICRLPKRRRPNF